MGEPTYQLVQDFFHQQYQQVFVRVPIQQHLGAGLKHFWKFLPDPWGNDPIYFIHENAALRSFIGCALDAFIPGASAEVPWFSSPKISQQKSHQDRWMARKSGGLPPGYVENLS